MAGNNWPGITPKVVAYYDLPLSKGVIIMRVVPNSPADKARLEEKDLIQKIGDVSINNMKDLINEINKKSVGDGIRLTVIRGKERFTVEAKLGKAPGDAWRILRLQQCRTTSAEARRRTP